MYVQMEEKKKQFNKQNMEEWFKANEANSHLKKEKYSITQKHETTLLTHKL